MTPKDTAGVLNARSDLPRALLPEEQQALLAVLGHADFDGRDQLLSQAKTAQVVGYCGCGCASVQLRVDSADPTAPRTPSPIPNKARVLDASGEDVGGVIVFLEGGRLSLLEIYSYLDPISPIPTLDHLRLERG